MITLTTLGKCHAEYSGQLQYWSQSGHFTLLLKENVFLTHFTLKFYFLTTEFLAEHDAFEQNSSRKMSLIKSSVQFSSVQLLSRVQLFVTPWIAARQTSLSITNSWSLHKLMSIELVMSSSHLILSSPSPRAPIPPSIRLFSNESTLRMRWPKYWSFSCSISPSNEHPRLTSFRWTGWISLQSKGLSRVFSNTTVEKHQFFGAQLSL